MTLLGHSVETPDYVPQTAWIGHGPFAMWLVRIARPRVIVELGTHYGYSYFALCQAVQAAGLPTRCLAVDTWQGDEHAGFYGAEVLAAVTAENRRYTEFSTLLQSTFKDALSHFEDGSVDLLHVDGRHFYADVKEDFESWCPKLSDRAIVLFHDTEVRERGFGVWRYWRELTEQHAGFSFPFQHGLGVLFWGAQQTPEVMKLRSAVQTEFGRDAIIALFGSLGDALVKSASNPGSPSPRPRFKFDPQLYLDLNPDVKAAGVDPYRHYLEYGIGEGRRIR